MTPRRGAILVEVAMALTVLIAAFVAIAQLLVISANQRREIRWRSLATQEAANILEHVMARPWHQLEPDEMSRFELSEEVRKQLPEPRLEVGVTPENAVVGADARGTSAVNAKRVRVFVQWRSGSGVTAEPVELVAWAFALEETE